MTKGTKRILTRCIDDLSDKLAATQAAFPGADLTEYRQDVAGLRERLGNIPVVTIDLHTIDERRL